MVKSKTKSKKDLESQQLLKSKTEDPHLREPIDELEKRVNSFRSSVSDEKAIIPLAGGVSSVSIICTTIFTLFITLQLDGVIQVLLLFSLLRN